MQGKAIDTGTTGSFEFRAFAVIAKTRADTAHFLSSPLPKSDALFDRGRHSAGEFRLVIEQRVIPGGHGDIHSHFQVSKSA